MGQETSIGRRNGQEDRAWCRAMLPRVSRTFAINIRLLRGTLGDSVRTAYLLCRAADALEDSWPGVPSEIVSRFERFRSGLAGDVVAAAALARDAASAGARGADLELVAGYPRLLRVHGALPAPDRAEVCAAVEVMAHGMSHYASRAAARPSETAYLDTETELRDYCWVVAGCVGVLLTRLFARRAAPEDASVTARRLELAPVVGQALQLTNILLDWPTDVRRGRCHLPAQWLRYHALRPPELVGSSRSGVQEIAQRLEILAREALASVPDYLDTIPGRHVRYRMFCLWPALWALASLRHARRDPEFPWGGQRPKLPRTELWRAALASLLTAHDSRAVRRLVAATAA